MITKLSVSNFKSVRQLDIECKKVNLFIGEPNTGKSNILETLALLSWCSHPRQGSLTDYVRLEFMQNLFFDQLLDQPVEIKISTTSVPPTGLLVVFAGDSYELCELESRKPFMKVNEDAHCDEYKSFGQIKIQFFRFKDSMKQDDKEPGRLKPPNGSNLFSVVFSSQVLRDSMEEFFRRYGLKLLMRQKERVFELVKQAEGPFITYPYILASDTLRRIIFYMVAMASNKDSILVFEEAESHAFPYYTKYLGERIALDQTNQFFIATHNPYLLSAIIEKARKEDVQVFITYFKNFQTQVTPLAPDQVVELMEADPFFNLDRFIEAEE